MVGSKIPNRVPSPMTLNELHGALVKEWEAVPQNVMSFNSGDAEANAG